MGWLRSEVPRGLRWGVCSLVAAFSLVAVAGQNADARRRKLLLTVSILADIGTLAVNGTVNDVAMAGARPLWVSAAFILEEGFPLADLERIVASMRAAAERAGILVVTGDTKVVERGKADGLYVNTAGVGVVDERARLGAAHVGPGDRVLVSGTLGDHGMAVMVARGELELEVDLASDTAPVHELAAALLELGDAIRWLRDPTRGGLATALNELAQSAHGRPSGCRQSKPQMTA